MESLCVQAVPDETDAGGAHSDRPPPQPGSAAHRPLTLRPSIQVTGICSGPRTVKPSADGGSRRPYGQLRPLSLAFRARSRSHYKILTMVQISVIHIASHGIVPAVRSRPEVMLSLKPTAAPSLDPPVGFAANEHQPKSRTPPIGASCRRPQYPTCPKGACRPQLGGLSRSHTAQGGTCP